MTSAFGIFVAAFLFVFFRAFQQRNVAFDNYRWVLPTSLCMAFSETYIIVAVATAGHYSIAQATSWGLGAGIGALLAMKIHKKYVKH